MINARRAGVLAVAACLAGPWTAEAQNVYAEQVATYLVEMEGRLLDDGFTLEGESTGWMMDGAEGATMVRLPAGSYTAFGACDDDCSDIDLMVSVPGTQEELDADREMDSFPIVEFVLDETTDVLLRMTMPDCATARCYAGYRWYSGMAAGDMAVGSWEEQVMAQLEALPIPDQASMAHERTGLVVGGEEVRFSVKLQAGSFGGVAVCDNDCSDVDLAVYDAAGELVSSDVLEDDVPIVDFEVRKGGGTYVFEVRMIACSVESCGYGFRLFRQN